MLCSEASIVNRGRDGYQAVTLRCRSWGCELCAPDRKKQLVALAKSGNPDTFVTLTVNPAFGTSPEDRARRLADAWRRIVRMVKKKYGYTELPYFAVFEATKKGEPHLHILARVKWISQKWLSEKMAELMEAPVVDIRRVRDKSKLAYYISKYMGKDPHRFSSCKRYWQTRGWEVEKYEPAPPRGWWAEKWSIETETIQALEDRWAARGMEVERRRHHLLAYHTGPPLAIEDAQWLAYLYQREATL